MSAIARMWQVHFVVLAVIWGSSFLLIKVAGEELTPVQVSFGRIALGSLALGLILIARRERPPKLGRIWMHLAFVGLLTNAIPFTLFAVGEERLSSLTAGLWNAATPLFAVAAVLLIMRERPTRGALYGVAIGFVGVVLLLAPWRDLEMHDLLSHLSFMVAAACYGIATPYMRRFLSDSNVSAVAMSCVQLGCAALMLLVVLPFAGGIPSEMSLETAASIAALGTLGSGFAYVLFYGVIRIAGPTTAATVTYVMPVVSTALGVTVLDEPLTWNLLLGGVIVLAGVLVGAQANRRATLIATAARTDVV